MNEKSHTHKKIRKMEKLEKEQSIVMLEKVKEQEAYLIKLRESLEQKKSNLQNSKTYQYERAKLIGMMDMLDVIKIDRSEFNWIFHF